MDLMTAAAIEFPCDVCGGQRAVSLGQILLSQEMLAHEGCVAPHGESECPPMVFAPLVEHELLLELQRIWRRLEECARAAGGRLVAGPDCPRESPPAHVTTSNQQAAASETGGLRRGR